MPTSPTGLPVTFATPGHIPRIHFDTPVNYAGKYTTLSALVAPVNARDARLHDPG